MKNKCKKLKISTNAKTHPKKKKLGTSSEWKFSWQHKKTKPILFAEKKVQLKGNKTLLSKLTLQRKKAVGKETFVENNLSLVGFLHRNSPIQVTCSHFCF